jgi:hypothetical protein
MEHTLPSSADSGLMNSFPNHIITRYGGEQQEILCSTSNTTTNGNDQVPGHINAEAATAFDENSLDLMIQGKYSINKLFTPHRYSC